MLSRLVALVLAVLIVLPGCGSDEQLTPPPPAPVGGAPLPMPIKAPTDSRLQDEAIAAHRTSVAVTSAFSPDARAAIEDPDSVRLYSIDNDIYRRYGYGKDGGDAPMVEVRRMLAAGMGVFGSIDLRNRDLLGRIVGGMYRGLAAEGPVAGCYEPRHALEFRKGAQTAIALICFECHYLVPLDATTRESGYRSFQDEGSRLKTLFDARLDAAGVGRPGR